MDISPTKKQQGKFVLPPGHFLFTSESVSGGHPDKMCDLISDSILDACLEQDPLSRVACESACKNTMCMVFGEITSNAVISYEQVARDAIKSIGYDSMEKGFDYKNAVIMIAIDKQSNEISNAVVANNTDENMGAGDQGLMIGYATDETPEKMPLTHALCNKLIERLTECRTTGICPWMNPDAKVQVTVEYKEEKGRVIPQRIHNIVISQQHTEKTTLQEIQSQLKEHVISHVMPLQFIDARTEYHLNPSGKFVFGGPYADAGLTGRKIIVDSYGGWGGHGGGAFSGKDPTKVDRSAAYAARWVAKSLVSNKLCNRVMIQLAYGIGISEPLSIYVNSYGTVIPELTDYDLQKIVEENFDLRPGMIIRELNLRRPIYKKTAQNGHFGRSDPDFTWEVSKDLDWKAWKERQQQ